jgi:hypothetical protein
MSKKLEIIALLALTFVMAKAQTVVSPILNYRMSFTNSVGLACAGCQLQTFAAGTTTPQATFTDPTGTAQNTNPIILDLTGSANILGIQAAYKFVLKDPLGNTLFTEDNIPIPCTLVTCSASSLGAVSLSDTSNQILQGPLQIPAITTGNLSSVVVVDGSIYPQTCAGIQSAVNAVASGGTVFLASGTYPCTSTVTITKPVNILGAGWGQSVAAGSAGTILNINGLSTSSDVFLIQPASTAILVGNTFKNFMIFSSSGTPGNHGIEVDTTTFGGLVASMIVDNVSIDITNGISIFANGPGNAGGGSNGNLRTSYISNSVLGGSTTSGPGGIACHQCGDTLTIFHNIIQGTGIGVDVDEVSGAAVLSVDNNNIVSGAGGIHLGQGTTGAMITRNEIETPTGDTGSNGALVDVDGASGDISGQPIIANNSFQIISGSTLNSLRINQASGAQVYGNRFGRGGSPSTDIVTTSNAIATTIGTNEFPAGFPLSQMLSDSGIATTFASSFDGYSLVVGSESGITTFNAAGTGVNTGIRFFPSGDISLGLAGTDPGVALAVGGTIANANGAIIPGSIQGFTQAGTGTLKLVVSTAIPGQGATAMTGPTSSTPGDMVNFSDALGTLHDSGVAISAASGMPSTCTVGQLWTNPSATSASNVLAVCFPANTFTFVTVP